MDPSQLVALIATLNPENTPGRLAVIVRMGATKLREKLPTLLEAVASAGQVVAWVCDPMHGNTEEVQGFKTRRYDNIRAEVEAFFDVHDECGTVPGGIHLEMTGEPASQPARQPWSRKLTCVGVWVFGIAGMAYRGPSCRSPQQSAAHRTLLTCLLPPCPPCLHPAGDNVTECIGGGALVGELDLSSRYHTHCDPRLNAEQALEMSFYVASRLRQRREKQQKDKQAKAGSKGVLLY